MRRSGLMVGRAVCLSLVSIFVLCLSAEAEMISLAPGPSPDSATVAAFFEIRGTGERQNPVRRKLSQPYQGDELFVRFRFRYEADSIDSPAEGDGEFFVLWLDRAEGGKGSSHSGGIPNVGIHVDEEGQNRFMIRYSSAAEEFGPPLQRDREFMLVARLAKSVSGEANSFDELSLWVDPDLENPGEPVAVIRSSKAIPEISWIGFSTARKTEPDDRITVGDLRVASDWSGLFGKGVEPGLTEIPPPPQYEPSGEPKAIVEVDPQPDQIITDHWSFQPIQRPAVPTSAAENWIQTPVDAFVGARQEKLGLVPAPPATDLDLTRRVSLVLTGLPPDRIVPRGEIANYAEELLDSTAYGERWGRHWLDVARWAESNGHQHNRIRDHAWRYRDWVVESFSANKPYDQFLREQLAGDEIVPFSPDQIIATGFLAAARYSGNELDKAIQRNDILVDITNATAKAFLGLTMECAQCHDHFFDPITQWDYFHLMSFFAKGQPGDVILQESDEQVRELVANRWGIFESVRNRFIESRRAAGAPEPILLIPKAVPGKMTAAEMRSFREIEDEIEQLPRAWAFYSPVTSPHDLEFAPTAMRWPLPFQKESLDFVSVRFLDRGDVGSTGPIADPRWPLVFGEMNEPSDPERPRLALADWLTGPDNPLTARVWANRIWQWYFGTGLVATSGDFGVAGAESTHPELLDWLASELIDSGWDTRHLHRLIVRSRTFQQSSAYSPANAALDPGNELLWRWVPRRLEAEAIRDSLLAVSGNLDREIGGKSVPLDEAEESGRRSLYLQQRRDNLPHQQTLFDGANGLTSCSKRLTSTVGLQPLWMMNSSFVERQAGEIANHVRDGLTQEDGRATAARQLVRMILLREASGQEIRDLESLLQDGDLELVATVLLNTNEFLYIP